MSHSRGVQGDDSLENEVSEYETAEEGSEDSFRTAVEITETRFGDSCSSPDDETKNSFESSPCGGFLECEAQVDGDESSGESGESGEDSFEASFVDDGHVDVTFSQKGRYLRSIQDLEDENTLISQLTSTSKADSEESYLNDSFCNNNSIEYEEVGDFTQSMLAAKEELKDITTKRKTRSVTKKEGNSKRKWRRIIVQTESDSE